MSSFGFRVGRVALSVLHFTVVMSLGDYEEAFAIFCLFFKFAIDSKIQLQRLTVRKTLGERHQMLFLADTL